MSDIIKLGGKEVLEQIKADNPVSVHDYLHTSHIITLFKFAISKFAIKTVQYIIEHNTKINKQNLKELIDFLIDYESKHVSLVQKNEEFFKNINIYNLCKKIIENNIDLITPKIFTRALREKDNVFCELIIDNVDKQYYQNILSAALKINNNVIVKKICNLHPELINKDIILMFIKITDIEFIEFIFNNYENKEEIINLILTEKNYKILRKLCILDLSILNEIIIKEIINNNDEDLLLLIIEKIDIEKYLLMFMNYVIKEQNLSIAKQIIKNYPNKLKCCNILHILINQQKFDMIIPLVESGINIKLKDNEETALITFCKYLDVIETEMAIDIANKLSHLDIINDYNILGNTALHYAVEKQSISIIKILIHAGADKEIKNKKGLDCIDIAMQYEGQIRNTLLYVLTNEHINYKNNLEEIQKEKEKQKEIDEFIK